MDRLYHLHSQRNSNPHHQPLHQLQLQHQHHQQQQQQLLPRPLQHQQEPLQENQSQHPGLQIDPRLHQQQPGVSSQHHPHALRPLQSASQASSAQPPAGYHSNIALPSLHVMNPGGPLAQNTNSQSQSSSGSAPHVQYHHPLASHPHVYQLPPPPTLTNLPLQQHQSQSHLPIQPSLHSLPPHQQAQNVPQRQNPVTLRPMPPSPLSAAPSSSDLQVTTTSILSSSSSSSSPSASASSSPPSSNPQPVVDPNQAGVIAGGRQVLSSGVRSPTVTGPADLSPSSRPTSARVSNEITPGATSQITPAKNKDGKFPCPHCPKTYLHAKHLKRHLLRHTGDRPYQCVLCKDTFSRSDILKRHFQKCSIRRGNPTGVTHLSHAHAHQQGKQGNSQNADAGTASSTSSTTAGGLSPSTSSPGGKKKSARACDQCVRMKVRCDLASPCERCRTKGGECTYSRSIKNQDSKDEGSLLPPVTFAEQVSQTVGHPSEGFNFPPPAHPQAHMAHQGRQQLQNVVESQKRQSQPQGSNQQQQSRSVNNISQAPPSTSFYANPHSQAPSGEVDWSSFMPIGDPSFMDPFGLSHTGGPSTDSRTSTTTADMENPNGGGVFGALYNGDPCAMSGIVCGFNGWTHLALHQIDPLQAKCDRLIEICFPENLDRSENDSPNQQTKGEAGVDTNLENWITPDNVKHFVHLFFVNFQGHFPMIHLPTFNITLIHDGLLLAVVCIGAVYSKRGITVDQVRSLIDRSFDAIDKSKAPPGPLQVEEIQARYFLHVLATWHGHRHQRENSRRRYGEVIQKARRAGLFQPLTPENPGASGFSVYHQLDGRPPTRQNWNWHAWIEQEKRNRVMFGIFLLNTAFVIFFNSSPQLQFHEIRLSLPADDAAWEAPDANECANCLGLNGEDGMSRNIAGSRQVQQPGFVVALKTLLHTHLDFNPGTTNAYSKFILIHALHVHIWTMQKVMANASEIGIGQTVGSMGRFGLVEWETEGQNRDGAYEGFGDGDMATNDATKAVRVIQYALEKWKRAWDTDLLVQYPSPTSRVGFCRDGLPFYWLGKLYLARNRTLDWNHGVDDDRTVAKVKNMLKHVQGFITDGTGRLDLQGAVSAIDQSFAMDELTYDMKLLFRPIEEIDRSPQQRTR